MMDAQMMVATTWRSAMLIEHEQLQHLRDACEMCDRIAVAMSGGRDSSLAAYWAIRAWREKVELVYVDTGVEFPDVEPYVFEFARRFNVPVRRLRGPTFFDVYGPFETFPAPQGRSCIHELIFNQIDRYNLERGDQFIQVAGAHPKQRQALSSTTAIMRKRIRSLARTITIVNPLYVEDVDELRREFLRVWHFWPGYKRGFQRTACWCCPFQTAKQYDALRANYPPLYERLMRMAATWATHDSDLERYYRKRFALFAHAGVDADVSNMALTNSEG